MPGLSNSTVRSWCWDKRKWQSAKTQKGAAHFWAQTLSSFPKLTQSIRIYFRASTHIKMRKLHILFSFFDVGLTAMVSYFSLRAFSALLADLLRSLMDCKPSVSPPGVQITKHTHASFVMQAWSHMQKKFGPQLIQTNLHFSIAVIQHLHTALTWADLSLENSVVKGQILP